MIRSIDSRARKHITDMFNDLYNISTSSVEQEKKLLDYMLAMTDEDWKSHYDIITENNTRICIEGIADCEKDIELYLLQLENINDWNPSDKLKLVKEKMVNDINDDITRLINSILDLQKPQKVFNIQYEKEMTITDAKESYERAKKSQAIYSSRKKEFNECIKELYTICEIKESL